MREASPHPSFLALDRKRLGETTREIDAHLDTCDRCRSYLEPTALEVPPWVRTLSPAPRSRPRTLRFALGFAAALIAAVVLFTIPKDSYVGVKGAPNIRVYVKRDDKVARWDGASPIHPGDAIRLSVAGAKGFGFVAVLDRTDDGRFTTLYSAPLAVEAKEQTLPGTWRVDANGAKETLIVILAHRPLGDEVDPLALTPEDDAWRTTIVIQKGGER